MNQKIRMNADTVWGVLIAAAVAFLLFIAYLPQKETLFSSGENMNWPRYLLWPLLALSLFLAGRGILREQRLRREAYRPSRFRGPLALAAICIVCFSLIDVVGFLPFVFIMAAAASVLLGRRHFSTHLIFSIAVTFFTWVIFAKALSMSLPRGMSLFRQISLLLY